MSERPFTHSQYNDVSGDEETCNGQIHHYVWVDGAEVCVRCGDVIVDE